MRIHSCSVRQHSQMHAPIAPIHSNTPHRLHAQILMHIPMHGELRSRIYCTLYALHMHISLHAYVLSYIHMLTTYPCTRTHGSVRPH